jgi:hypothetical protein
VGVIGRLDEQVDALLIKPLKRGRGEDEGEQTQQSASDPAAAHETPRPPQEAQVEEQRQAADELPVWLL